MNSILNKDVSILFSYEHSNLRVRAAGENGLNPLSLDPMHMGVYSPPKIASESLRPVFT